MQHLLRERYSVAERWVKTVRVHRVVFCLVLLFLSSLALIHYYVYYAASDSSSIIHKSRVQLEFDGNDINHPDAVMTSDLVNHINDLKRVKTSINNELRILERNRMKLIDEISQFEDHLAQIKPEYNSYVKEVEQIKLSIRHLLIERTEAESKNLPIVHLPRKVITFNDISPQFIHISSSKACTMHTCFDYSRCSLFSGFPVYFYEPHIYIKNHKDINDIIKTSVTSFFGSSSYSTKNPDMACIFVVLIGETISGGISGNYLSEMLHSLPYWKGRGQNHVIINLSRTIVSNILLQPADIGCAIAAQSYFTIDSFRHNYDIILPPYWGASKGDIWEDVPPLSPIHRKFLMSFNGEFSSRVHINRTDNTKYKLINQQKLHSGLWFESAELEIVRSLKKIQVESPNDVYLNFSCISRYFDSPTSDWRLCENEGHRRDLLTDSTFSIILSPVNYSLISTLEFQIRLFEATKYGAVPVIVGDYARLPFDEILDWSNCALILPSSRITEMHFVIRTLSDNVIASFRRQCRLFYEMYFSKTDSYLDTLLAVIRTRLKIPAHPARDEPSQLYYHSQVSDNNLFVAKTELLGPVEEPFASPKFVNNFSVTRDVFKIPGDPFHSYPYYPSLDILPAEAKFLGSGLGFRPVGDSLGGHGQDFKVALGGNIPREQFTIVTMTYKREKIMMQEIQKFNGLPYLNKVVVVWNSPYPPNETLRWPQIHVPIQVVMAERNSLNNRFLPYDVIETEAVLSIDDDVHLYHGEIIIAFRVWRENRDVIVGFPARYHTWDATHNSWLYNSNHTCELSMVLTGAAFYHKYYMYQYSYHMPQVIRDKVDEYMNCEDIAMNFLVSHITRKPPIKVTLKWTFPCKVKDCKDSISGSESHFNERHKCINFFVRVYGYMPLLYTQYRADSVLYKTKLPRDKQKCFNEV